MANIKKQNPKTWSEEAINALINCFQSHEWICDVTNGDYKDQSRKSLSSEEFDMSVCKKTTSIDMTMKKWNTL